MPSNQKFGRWLSSKAKLLVSNVYDDHEAIKIVILRLGLISCLIAAAIATTVASNIKLTQNEHELFQSQFESTAQNALNTMVNSFQRMNLGIQEMASTYSHNFPNQEDWPTVAWTGFQPSAQLLGQVSAVPTVAILPIVYPDKVSIYEPFIANYYNGIDPYADAETFLFPYFPPGTIFSQDFSQQGIVFQIDHYGNLTNNRRQMMVPISQYTISLLAVENQVGYNVYSNFFYTDVVDAVMDCVDNSNDITYKTTQCGTLARPIGVPLPTNNNPSPDILDVVAAILQPVFPVNNRSELVGFAAGSMSWIALLSNIIPTSVGNLYCVISTDFETFTFLIEHGQPRVLGNGDLHDSKFSEYGMSAALLHPSVKVTESSSYTLTFYPAQDFADDYETDLPLTGALVLLFIFLFCSALFATYDVLMQRKFGRNQAVLDTKRRFVRFISHEIRTPLNIIALGMKLLDVEMDKVSTSIRMKNPNEMQVIMKKSLCSWKNLTKEIVESSESAVEVLNDLLNYDKIEVGALKLEFTCFNVRDLVQRTVSMLQVQAQLKDINIQLLQDNPLETAGRSSIGDLSLEDCMVVGDEARMGQVLRNLISNALKFTPSAGEVTVTVATSPTCLSLPEKVRVSSPLFQTMAQTGTVRIAVKDSGAGLSPQQLEQICAEGVQFNANELQAGQGSGLGLFISKGIVEQHGGKLTVSSEGLGKGVTFIVEVASFKMKLKVKAESKKHLLNNNQSKSAIFRKIGLHSKSSTIAEVVPIQETEQLSSDHALLLESNPSSWQETAVSSTHTNLQPTHRVFSTDSYVPTAGITVAPSRFLVVDDSPFNRKMLIRLMSSKEHKCEQAEDGAVALRKYEEMLAWGEPPDAILMDFEMPVMNGPTATARLREMGCRCLIVGVTGNVLPADVAYFKEHGADAVLPKPLVLEDFELILSERIRNQEFCVFDSDSPPDMKRNESNNHSSSNHNNCNNSAYVNSKDQNNIENEEENMKAAMCLSVKAV